MVSAQVFLPVYLDYPVNVVVAVDDSRREAVAHIPEDNRIDSMAGRIPVVDNLLVESFPEVGELAGIVGMD